MLWAIPLLLTGADALAWGLYTHVHFAQLLLWAVPLAHPAFRRAARALPHLVLAGACAPDVSLMARPAGAPAFAGTHRWPVAAQVLGHCETDAQRAMALGYASHLLADVIAHHHFVPAHHHVWFDAGMATHVAAEWAMDHHVAPQLFATPAQLLERHGPELAEFLARHFDCGVSRAHAAVRGLMRCERLLRASALPAAIAGVARVRDAHVGARFEHYLAETARRLRQIDRLIAGEFPVLEPETCAARARDALAGRPLPELRLRLALPTDLFAAAEWP